MKLLQEIECIQMCIECSMSVFFYCVFNNRTDGYIQMCIEYSTSVFFYCVSIKQEIATFQCACNKMCNNPDVLLSMKGGHGMHIGLLLMVFLKYIY